MSDQENININNPEENKNFWQQRWVDSKIGFHKETIHPMLEKHLDKLIESGKNAKILFPLCGKAVDMAWLASLGHDVIGIELTQEAIEQFFVENKIEYNVEDIGDFKVYKSLDGKIRLYKGDFFKFTSNIEGFFECIWDRGSLVALPIHLRIKYAEHIKTLLDNKFQYLLDSFDYDQDLYSGPPYCVKIQEINQLYGNKCKIQQIDSKLVTSVVPIGPKLVDENSPFENIFLLTNN